MSMSVSGNGVNLAQGHPQCHPYQDYELSIPASALSAGSPGPEWQWHLEEPDGEVSLTQGAGQPLSLCSALWSGIQAVWAAASAGRAPPRQLGTETGHGQPQEVQDKPLICKAFSNGHPFVTCVLL